MSKHEELINLFKTLGHDKSDSGVRNLFGEKSSSFSTCVYLTASQIRFSTYFRLGS